MATMTLTVTERTVPPSDPLYGFFEALADAANDGELAALGDWDGILEYYSDSHLQECRESVTTTNIQLWPNGCFIDGVRNCTKACMDPQAGPSVIWDPTSAMFTMYNCMVYPILAVAAGRNWLEDPSGLLDKYSISKNISRLGGSSAFSIDVDAWPAINDCIAAASGGDSNPIAVPTGVKIGPPEDTWEPHLIMQIFTCPAPSFNPDILGPGVLISYITQLYMTILLWVLVDALYGWSNPFWTWCYRKLRPRPWNSRHDKFQDVKGAVLTASVNFQKTQVFFAATLQTAALVGLRSASEIGASDWASLIENLASLSTIALLGIFPIVQNLLSLRKDSALEWFSIATSTVGILISTASIFVLNFWTVSPAETSLPENVFSQCGGFAPGQTCKRAAYYISFDAGYWACLPPVLVTMLCLIFEKIKVFRSGGVGAEPQNLFEYLGTQFPRISRFKTATLLTTLSLLAELYVAGMTCYILTVLMYDLPRFNSSDGVDPNWSFGQVIAVGLWIPVIAEWLYLTISGMEKGFKHLLSAKYKIVKADSEDASPRINLDDDMSTHALLATGHGAFSLTTGDEEIFYATTGSYP